MDYTMMRRFPACRLIIGASAKIVSMPIRLKSQTDTNGGARSTGIIMTLMNLGSVRGTENAKWLLWK